MPIWNAGIVLQNVTECINMTKGHGVIECNEMYQHDVLLSHNVYEIYE